MGKSAQSWEMLAGLVMVVLVSGWSEGHVLSKCELRSRLQAAFFLEDRSDFIAKMVCTVEYISYFNTNLVTTVNRPNPRPYFGPPDYPRVYNQPTEVIGEESVPGERVLIENPVSPPDMVVDDGFIPDQVFPTEVIAEPEFPEEGLPTMIVEPEIPSFPLEVVIDNQSGDEGSGEPCEDGSGVHPGGHSKENGKEEGEEGSAHGNSEEWSGSGFQVVTDKPPIITPDVIDDSLYPESGSGEPLEPTITISRWEHSENVFFAGGTIEGPVKQPRFPGGQFWRALFRHKQTTDISPWDRSNNDIFEDGTGIPFNNEDRPFTNYEYGQINPDNEQDPISRTLYGIFQLSDDMACQSQWRNSANFCNLNCEDLTDSDITDDIACLMTLKQQGRDMMIVEQCQSVEPSEYFSGCG